MSDKAHIKKELEDALQGGAGSKVARYALAVVSGAIPFAGGLIGGAASAWSEAEQAKFNKLLEQWLKLQEQEIVEIGKTLFEVMIRVDQNDAKVRERMESPAYLSLVRKCFRDWSAAESEAKRQMIRNLLANAASCEVTTDDVLRLFIEWIEKYSEAHFKVVACVHGNTGITRAEIWADIYGQTVREDSAEADLFKTIIHDLSVGHIIRQHRETNYQGQYIRARPSRGKKYVSDVLKSAFDDEKQYELTGLGRQFVHYAMTEIVPKIGAPGAGEAAKPGEAPPVQGA